MNRLSIPLREHVSVFVAYPLDAAQKEEEREMESAATSLKRIEEKVLKREGKNPEIRPGKALYRSSRVQFDQFSPL